MKRNSSLNLTSRFILLSLALPLSNVVLAHHSRANYQMQEFVEVEGVITEFAWSNPHAYIVIELPNPAGVLEAWQLEMNSLPILTEMNWSSSSISVGETIRVRANPDRNTAKKQLFVRYVEKLNGTRLWSFGRPASERPQVAATATRTPLPGSTDYTGVWERARIRDDHPSRSNRFGTSWLPANEAGEAAMANFDPNADPAYECLPRTLPSTILPVYPARISRPDETLVVIEYEFNSGFREIFIGQTEHPEDAEPSHLGYSIGRWEDGDLVVHTRNFTAARWGLGRGLPSSESKEVFERYKLSENGKRIEVEWTVIDPVFLAEPYTDTGGFILNNGVQFSDFNCDPRAARRHLSIQDDTIQENSE
jgi:hypothetical protein